MEFETVTHENWLTLPPQKERGTFALFLVLVLSATTLAFLTGFGDADKNMAASAEGIYGRHEYWRAWTALFAHADGAHLLSNLVLFLPFAYLLSSYFSLTFFPLMGFFIGGWINFLVVKTMPETTSLIGASGVVYWMGAAWITLAFLIDRRESIGKRLLKSAGVSILLFIPNTYQPQVSYLAHFLGFVFGVVSAGAYYAVNRSTFISAEIHERRLMIDPFWIEGEWENPRLAETLEGPPDESDGPSSLVHGTRPSVLSVEPHRCPAGCHG